MTGKIPSVTLLNAEAIQGRSLFLSKISHS